MAQVDTGQVNILAMNLIKVDGSSSFPIMAQIQTISFWESIHRSVMIAEFNLTDGLNVLKDFPIIGAEYINLQFQTPGVSQIYNLNLYVYAVTNVRINAENNWQTYTLKCCSKEFLLDSSTTTCKAYNTTIDQMVGDQVSNVIGSKKVLISTGTQGVQTIVVPTQSPLETIEMLRKRAVSPIRKSSSHVFFENRDGFHFTTIEDLISTGQTSNIKTYKHFTAQKAEFQNQVAHWGIVDYVGGQQFNVVDTLKSGTYNGQAGQFDLQTKQMTNTVFTSDQYSNFVSPDSGATPSNILVIAPAGSPVSASNVVVRSVPDLDVPLYNKAPAINMLHFTDSAESNTFIAQALPSQMGFLAPFLTTSYDIYINGDTSLTTGDLINIQINDPDKLTDHPTTTPDTLTNGNYLVIAMRHNILISARDSKYTVVATISKGNYT